MKLHIKITTRSMLSGEAHLKLGSLCCDKSGVYKLDAQVAHRYLGTRSSSSAPLSNPLISRSIALTDPSQGGMASAAIGRSFSSRRRLRPCRLQGRSPLLDELPGIPAPSRRRVRFRLHHEEDMLLIGEQMTKYLGDQDKKKVTQTASVLLYSIPLSLIFSILIIINYLNCHTQSDPSSLNQLWLRCCPGRWAPPMSLS